MLERVIDTQGFNAVVKGRYGHIIFNKNDVYIGRAVEKYGEFSEYEVRLFREICKEGDVVVEVGANIGTHTLALSKIVGKRGRVFAYEPQRIVFQTLCANMALNSVENVECFQIAASSKDGYVLIPEIRYDLEGNFGGIEVNKFKQGDQVPTAKLQNILNLPRLNFLKIDVEGMEYGVISGAKKLIEKHKPIMYVENDRQENSKALIELIWSLDYKAYWHLPPLFNPDNFAGDSENIYENIVSVNMVCVPASLGLAMTHFHEVTDSNMHPMQKG